MGEFEVRGPWITGSYYGDPSRTGSTTAGCARGTSGRSTRWGYMQISDRSKDVIKSGGEWISSVELENEVMAHPDVVEAAVIAVPDERWSERPLVAVVLGGRSSATPDDLLGLSHPTGLPVVAARAVVDHHEVPKTSVGKFDKKVLRARHAEGDLEVIEVEDRSAARGCPISTTSPSAWDRSPRTWRTPLSTDSARTPTRCEPG